MRISDWSSDVCSSDLRDQELMLQVVLVAHGRSIGKRCAGDKRRAAGRCIPALQRRALIASISWPPMSVPYAVSISRAQVGLVKLLRSEERRVGTKCVSTWIFRGSQYH